MHKKLCIQLRYHCVYLSVLIFKLRETKEIVKRPFRVDSSHKRAQKTGANSTKGESFTAGTSGNSWTCMSQKYQDGYYAKMWSYTLDL